MKKLTLDVQKYMDLELNDGTKTTDGLDRACIKCCFINAVNIPLFQHEMWQVRLSRLYHVLFGKSNWTKSKWREDYAELCGILDHFEQRLMWEKNNLPMKLNFDDDKFKLELLAVLKERELVEFINETREMPLGTGLREDGQLQTV